MSLDRLVDFMIEAAENEKNKNKAMSICDFRFERRTKELIVPSKSCARHHRKRETFYMESLENAEKELREKGVSVEVVEQGLAPYMGNVISGSMVTPTSNFAPKIDQKLLEAVKLAKTKVIEHRNKAERYEKLARAFTCCPPDATLELSVEDVDFFRLES